MSEPTPAEIQAGARAFAEEALDSAGRWTGRATPSEVAVAVLRAVLPDHDAQVRADERARVAEEIAQEIEAEYNRMVSDGLAVAAVPYGHARDIARAHATTGEDTPDGQG